MNTLGAVLMQITDQLSTPTSGYPMSRNPKLLSALKSADWDLCRPLVDSIPTLSPTLLMEP